MIEGPHSGEGEKLEEKKRKDERENEEEVEVAMIIWKQKRRRRKKSNILTSRKLVSYKANNESEKGDLIS